MKSKKSVAFTARCVCAGNLACVPGQGLATLITIVNVVSTGASLTMKQRVSWR